MADIPETDQLLNILIKLIGRLAYPEQSLRKIIFPSSASEKYLKAYNLCDGTKSRIEIAKVAGLDKDNFNKRVIKWIEQGILFEIGPTKSPRLLHLYPISSKADAFSVTTED